MAPGEAAAGPAGLPEVLSTRLSALGSPAGRAASDQDQQLRGWRWRAAAGGGSQPGKRHRMQCRRLEFAYYTASVATQVIQLGGGKEAQVNQANGLMACREVGSANFSY